MPLDIPAAMVSATADVKPAPTLLGTGENAAMFGSALEQALGQAAPQASAVTGAGPLAQPSSVNRASVGTATRNSAAPRAVLLPNSPKKSSQTPTSASADAAPNIPALPQAATVKAQAAADPAPASSQSVSAAPAASTPAAVKGEKHGKQKDTSLVEQQAAASASAAPDPIASAVPLAAPVFTAALTPASSPPGSANGSEAMDASVNLGGELLSTAQPLTEAAPPTEPSAALPTDPSSALPTGDAAVSAASTAASSAAPSQAPAMPAAAAMPVSQTANGSPAAPLLQNGPASADNQSSEPPGNSAGQSVAATPVPKPAGEAHHAPSNAAPKTDAPTQSANAPSITAASFTAAPAAASSAAPVTAPALTAGEGTRALQQVADGAQTLAAQTSAAGTRQVTVHLHPQEWGQVSVSVAMTQATGADGTVSSRLTAHVVADQPSVKAALETHQSDLRQALKDAGLNIDRVTISVRPAAAAQSGAGAGSSGTQNGSSFSGGSPGTSAQSAGTQSSNLQNGAFGAGNSPASAAYSQGGQGSQGRHQPTSSGTQAEGDNAAEAPAPSGRPQTGLIDTLA